MSLMVARGTQSSSVIPMRVTEMVAQVVELQLSYRWSGVRTQELSRFARLLTSSLEKLIDPSVELHPT